MAERSPGKMKHMVSVVMPVYNAKAYVAESIRSILNQSYKDFELIVVDDCSTDGTPEIVKGIDTSEIRFFINPVNSGPGATLNFAIAQAKGDFIAVMHADDIATPDRLEKQVHYLQQHGNIAVVGTQVKLLSDDGSETASIHLPTDPDVIRYSLLFENCLCHPSVMIRRNVFDKGIRYADIRLNEDYELWIQFQAAGLAMANMEDTCLHYRTHPEQASSKFAARETSESIQLRDRYRSLFSTQIQHIITVIEEVKIEEVDAIAKQIRQLQLPVKVKAIFFNKLSFYIHSVVKHRKQPAFGLRKYFHFLQQAGWRNVKAPILYRLLLNGSF